MNKIKASAKKKAVKAKTKKTAAKPVAKKKKAIVAKTKPVTKRVKKEKVTTVQPSLMEVVSSVTPENSEPTVVETPSDEV